MDNHSNVDEILEQEKAKKRKEEEEIKKLEMACKEIFTTPDAFYLLKFLYKISLWAEQDTNINSDILIYKKGRRDYWAILRNVIPKGVLAQVEIYGDNDEQK